MAIYEVDSDRIIAIQQTSFEEEGLREREDLQRLLKTQIDVVCPAPSEQDGPGRCILPGRHKSAHGEL